MITLLKAKVDKELFEFCVANPVVAKALRLFDRDSKDWVGMARILELVEADIGGRPEVVKRGWATRSKLNLFFHTANTAGDTARHGDLKDEPRKPMTLTDAQQLMRHILNVWLYEKYGKPLV
jgi:hypothetical protein